MNGLEFLFLFSAYSILFLSLPIFSPALSFLSYHNLYSLFSLFLSVVFDLLLSVTFSSALQRSK